MSGKPTIFEALAAVMNDVQGVAKRERNNTPGGSFNFRGIDAVTNAVGPALRKHGVIVVPEVLEKSYGTVTVGQRQTVMGHAQVTIRFTWYGPAGDSIVSVTAGEAFDSGDKATAKAHSVAFRTAMIQTLTLPTDEPDPDEQSYQRSGPDPAPQRSAPAPATQPQESPADVLRRKILDLANGDARRVVAAYKSDYDIDIRQDTDLSHLQAFHDQLAGELAAVGS